MFCHFNEKNGAGEGHTGCCWVWNETVVMVSRLSNLHSPEALWHINVSSVLSFYNAQTSAKSFMIKWVKSTQG